MNAWSDKSLKEKKKVPGCSIEEMKVKTNAAVVEDTEEMRKMEKFESERHGLMLEKIWRREWKNKSWTSTRSKMARERGLQR